MGYYETSFYGLLTLCAGLLASQPTRRNELKKLAESRKQVSRYDIHPEANWYKAYGLVMGADWLQVCYKGTRCSCYHFPLANLVPL